MTDESMQYDVVIVGGGAAGLSAAIRLKQLNADVSVCVLEKGSEVGAHILSGAVLETRALDELLPNWAELGAPLNVPVKSDYFTFLTKSKVFGLPTPPQMNNHGNYIVSLGNLCRWLGEQAAALGVDVFAGFPAADYVCDDSGRVVGIKTGDMGRAKDGSEKAGFQEGITIGAGYVIFAEGCRGSLSERLMEQFALREGVQPQTYGLGIKELWEVPPEQHEEGKVWHSVGWPLPHDTYGGSFLYHLDGNRVAVGFVVGLDYSNPYLSPYESFQQFKTHPAVAKVLTGGRRLSYGARALNEGGWQSIPKLTMPGGVLTGCAAGFLNVPKIKGTHTAMKSGMLAAEAVAEALAGERPDELVNYETAVRASWIADELKPVRNIRPSFSKGLLAGLLYSAIDTYLLRGKAPWTFKHHADHESLVHKDKCRVIDYPKHDGVLSFDRLSSVYLSNTNHEEDQPCHLQLRDEAVPIQYNLAHYDAPEQRYCPAGVYEIVEEAGEKRLQINAQNCVHCKSCDIKDPKQNIHWVTPEGGGGPNYSDM